MDVPKFEYIIGIRKKNNIIKAVSFHSPYEDINKAKDDINVMIFGVDLKGMCLQNYKVINLENREDGFYWAKVVARFIPNGDNTYDQIFELRELIKGEKNNRPF